MRFKSAAVVLLLVLSLSTARAAVLIGPNDIRTALLPHDVVIDDYALDSDDLIAFYAARDYRPAWDPVHHEEGSTFSAFLDSVDQVILYHGLVREDYALEQMHELIKSPDINTPIKLELLATDTLLRLAHDLHGDSMDLNDLYPGWTLQKSPLDIPVRLADAVNNDKLNDFINSLAPDNPVYTKLAETLDVYRKIIANGGFPLLEPGPPLHLSDRNKRVLELRNRLKAEGYKIESSKKHKSRSYFDRALAENVEDFQRRHGLQPDGQVGGKTMEELSIPASVRMDQIMANMERLRHIPADFPPSRYALVNIPTMTLVVMQDGTEKYRGPVIVGQVERKTPFIASTVRSMIINPIWHVPTKIAREDILPKLRKDPHYLEKLGFVIKGSANDPYGEHIDWASMPEQQFDFSLRQSPGDMNSLGRLKFDFDNDYAVYMHGTPHQELFDKSARAFSSGCIRLRDPEEIAALLLADNKDPWSVARISDEIASKKTRWVGIANPLPLYILYWTVFLGEDGEVNFRDDIYDYDNYLMKNMRPSLEPEQTKPEHTHEVIKDIPPVPLKPDYGIDTPLVRTP